MDFPVGMTVFVCCRHLSSVSRVNPCARGSYFSLQENPLFTTGNSLFPQQEMPFLRVLNVLFVVVLVLNSSRTCGVVDSTSDMLTEGPGFESRAIFYNLFHDLLFQQEE